MLGQGMADPGLKAALNAAKALTPLILELQSASDVKHFHAILPAIFHLLDRVISEAPEVASSVVELFELALESDEPLLEKSLEPLVERVMLIAGAF
jgi:hypothetical protein